MAQNQRTVEQYRQRIFILKRRLAQQQQTVTQLQQQYSEYNIAEQQSAQFKLKSKILQLSMGELTNQQRKYSSHKAADFYLIMFAVRKLIKSCEIMSVTPQMMFRGCDRNLDRVVPYEDFQKELVNVYRLPPGTVSVISDILKSIGKDKVNLTAQCWEFFLQVFLLKRQRRQSKKPPPHEDAYNKLVTLVFKQKVKMEGLWDSNKLDMAQFAYGLTSQLKQLSVIEAIAVFSRLDPTRSGYVDKRELSSQIQQKAEVLGRDQRLKLKK